MSIAATLPTSEEYFVAALKEAKTNGSEFHGMFPPADGPGEEPIGGDGRPIDMSDLERLAGDEGASSIAAPAPRQRRLRTEKPPTDASAPTGQSALSGPQQRVLNAIAWWQVAGVPEPTRIQVAVVAGYSPNGSAFTNPLSSLRTAGLITYPSNGTAALTQAGRDLAQAPQSPPTTAELHQQLYTILNGPQRRLLDVVIRAYPAPIDRETLASKSGYSAGGSAFTNPLSSLRSLGLVDYPKSGLVIAQPILFIGRRPRAVAAGA